MCNCVIVLPSVQREKGVHELVLWEEILHPLLDCISDVEANKLLPELDLDS